MYGKRRLVVSDRDLELVEIANFWRSLPSSIDLAGTCGRSLVDLRRDAMNCLRQSPPDLQGARAATAEAIFNLRQDGES